MISQIYVIINGTDTIIFSLVRGNLQGHIPGGGGGGGLPYETDGDARRLA